VTPYIVLLLMVCLFLFAYKVTRSIFFIYPLVLIIILFCGLRASSVGIDTNNYVGMFHSVDLTTSFFTNSYSFEYGFALLLKVTAFFSNDYWLFLLVAGGLPIYFNVRALYSISHDFVISMFLFMTTCTYFFVFNGLRQAIAASIFSMAIVALVRNQKLNYLAWILIAALFHQSVIVAIPCFWVVRHPFSFKFITYLFFAVIVFIFTISHLDLFMSVNDSQRYTQYIDRGATGAGLLTFFFMMLSLFYIYMRKFIVESSISEYDIYLNLSVIVTTIYVSVWLMGLDVNLVRLTLYFSFGHLLIWPFIFQCEFNGFKPIITLCFTLTFTLFFYIYLNKMGYVPYALNPSFILF